MEITRTRNGIRLPDRIHCIDEECLNVYTNQVKILYPNRVNILDLGICITVPSDSILQIRYHVCNEPWRILYEFIHPNSEISLQLPVITRVKCTLQPDTVICHMKLTSITEAYKKIQGMFFLNYMYTE